MDWAINDEEIVAEGRWQSQDPKALVNGLPLGSNAVKVFVDVVLEPDIFLWRSTVELSKLEACLKSFVAWPANRVVFFPGNTYATGSISPLSQSVETPPAPIKKSQAPSQSPTQLSQQSTPEAGVKENQKCLLMMDITEKKRVVAKERWFSNNPDLAVHFVPLGPNAVRAWVDIVKVNDAAVWRPSSYIECMEDAIGTTIAWPDDKIVIV